MEMHFSVSLGVCVCVSVVTGAHRAAVASAVTRVEVLIDSFRRKQPFTHFLSFPLNAPQVQEGFVRFREQVLEHCGQVRERELSLKTHFITIKNKTLFHYIILHFIKHTHTYTNTKKSL